jgi:arylsulfatase A-like enzyme/lipopolysaccharide biosynthesis regulator YciM
VNALTTGEGPHRRRLVAGALAALVATGGVLGCGRREQPAPAAPPSVELLCGIEPSRLNVILITIDTLRADRLSCYGSTRVETPNLDRLASEGVRFDNAASTVPFTLPAHSSIMTGSYPPSHGVRENVGYFLEEGTPTIARSLKAGGRSTGGFVSAFVLDSKWGIGQGFDRFFDDFDLKEMETANLSTVQRPGGETIAEAVRWLDAGDQSSPFFLWLHLYDPHDPYTPPEPYKSRYDGRPYDGEVAYTDALVGEFRQALEARDLFDRALVVVTGDHGEGLGDHGERFHGFFVYESTIHVPLIVRFPNAAGAGRVVDGVVSHVDLYPTILDAVRLPVPERVHGISLLPMIEGREGGADRGVYSESFYPLLHYGWSPLRAFRSGRYKLIDAPRRELYDLVDDRAEATNLAREDTRVVGDLEGRLRRMREEMEEDAPSGRAPSDLDQETIDRLRALGYVAGSGNVGVDEEGDRPRADPKDKIELHKMIMATQSQIGAGDTAAAAELLARVVDEDPSIIDAHQMLGQIAMGDGDYDEAVEHFKRALQLDDNHRASMFGLAAAYAKLGRDDEAILGYQRLFDLSSRDVKAALPLSELYEKVGRIDDAAAVLEEVCAQPETPAFLINRLGELRALQQRRGEAAALFERAIAANAELVNPYFNLANLAEESGDLERAVRFYESAIERAPQHFQAQFNLGRLYGQMGDVARQRELWEAAIVSNPEFARGYYYLAKLLMDQGGDLARAEELARRGIAEDPTGQAGPLGYLVLADLLNRTGRLAEAQEVLAKGRALQSD